MRGVKIVAATESVARNVATREATPRLLATKGLTPLLPLPLGVYKSVTTTHPPYRGKHNCVNSIVIKAFKRCQAGGNKSGNTFPDIMFSITYGKVLGSGVERVRRLPRRLPAFAALAAHRRSPTRQACPAAGESLRRTARASGGKSALHPGLMSPPPGAGGTSAAVRDLPVVAGPRPRPKTPPRGRPKAVGNKDRATGENGCPKTDVFEQGEDRWSSEKLG